jgi:hypothetical protein
VCTFQVVILRDSQSTAWVLPWRGSSAITLQLMMRRRYSCFEGSSATYHGLLSPLLLGARARVSVGHFAGLLAAERLAAPSVWHLSVSPSTFVVVVLAKCKEHHCPDFPE